MSEAMNSTRDPFADLTPWTMKLLADSGWVRNPRREGLLAAWQWDRLGEWSRERRQRIRRTDSPAESRDAWMAYASPFVDDLVRQTVPEDVANLALHPSRRVLAELYGLEVASPPTYIVHPIRFNARDRGIDPELIRELTLIAKTLLIPVGEYPSLAWILLGANGMLLTLGWVAAGVYFLGNTFGAGLEAYFWQANWTPVYFEPTIRKDFRFPDVSADDPTAHRFE